MKLIVNIHSISDIITNSSSETFVIQSDKEKSDLEEIIRGIIATFHEDSNHLIVKINTPEEEAIENSYGLPGKGRYTIEELSKFYALTSEQLNGAYIIELDKEISVQCKSHLCSIFKPLYSSLYFFKSVDGNLIPLDFIEAMRLSEQGNKNCLSGYYIDTDGNLHEADVPDFGFCLKYYENEDLNKTLPTLN